MFTTPSRSSAIRCTTTLSSILTPLLCACSAVLLLVSLCPHVCLLRCQLVLERCVSLFVTLPLSLALLPCFLESSTMCSSLLLFFFLDRRWCCVRLLASIKGCALSRVMRAWLYEGIKMLYTCVLVHVTFSAFSTCGCVLFGNVTLGSVVTCLSIDLLDLFFRMYDNGSE